MINYEIFNQYLMKIIIDSPISNKCIKTDYIIHSKIHKFINNIVSKINNPILNSKILMLTFWKLTNVNSSNNINNIISVNIDKNMHSMNIEMF